ncbi:MAG: hypothetical protein AB1673_05290 [Actinomycetota bacterium]
MAVSNTPDPATLPEEGGLFVHTVTVTNTGPTPVRIVSLLDSVAGDLTTQSGSTCATAASTVLAPGATYSCSFTLAFSGEGGATRSNTVSVTAVDGQGRLATAQSTATVSLFDVPPEVEVTVTVTPEARPEPGGTFTYAVAVTNTSNPETVTIVELRSDTHGDLSGRGTCRTGVVLMPGRTFTCSFTATFTGRAGSTLVTQVVVTVEDNEGTRATATSPAAGGTVRLTAASPSAASPTPPAAAAEGHRASVALTGPDVQGPARIATALVLMGTVMLGLSWRRARPRPVER